MSTPRIWFVRALALAALLTLGFVALPAQTSKGNADFHLKAYDAHVAMTSASPYKDQAWKFLGPTNVMGRVADVAVADYPTSRRLYAGTCCGGVWQSDDLGQTWKPVFEHAASSAIGDVTVAPSNPDIVWVGTGETNIYRSSYAGSGVYKSTDGAKTWTHMGLTDSQTIGRVVIHPTNPDIVYVAASGHEWTDNEMRGVYKTTDGGRNWAKLLYKGPQTGAVDLVMDPSDPNVLYAAMWQRERRKWADPRTEATFDQSGIYKTADAGKTWTRLDKGLPPGNELGRIGLDIAQSNPKVVYAFVDNYARGDKAPDGTRNPYGVVIDYYPIGNEVYRSDDQGATWVKRSGQTPEQKLFMRNISSSYGWVFGNTRVDPRDENTIYILALGVSVSHDGGTTFEGLGRRGGPPPAPPPPAVPAVAGQRTTAGAAQAGPGVIRPITQASPGGDNHAMLLDPKDPNFMLSGNDSGFRVSKDGGVSWTLARIPSTTFFDMAFDMDTPFKVYGSVQDHGSYRAVVDLKNGVNGIEPVPFQSAPGGEGSTHAIDPTNPNIVYSAGTYGAISRSDLMPNPNPDPAAGGRGRGGNNKNIRPQPGQGDGELRGQWLAPMILSPHDHNTLYFGLQYLYRSKDRGDTWEKLTPDISGGDKSQLGEVPYQTIISISESPKKQGLLYAGTDNGHLQVSIDQGKEWTDLTAKLMVPNKWIAKVLASKYNEGTVYVAQQGRYDDDFGVYLSKSTDYGKTWKSIAGNLPSGPMNMIQEDPVNPNVLYTCNDFGVYVSTNGGQKWDVLGGNLPSANVMDFIIHPRDKVLVAATHGRGVWVIDVSRFSK